MHANFHYISLILIKHFFPLCKTNDQKRNNYELAVPKIVASQRRISEASEAAPPPRMVFASIREHAEHCDFFASTSRNKKICFASLRATQKFGEHEQASTRLNFANKSSKGKILRAVKNLMDHSSPL